MSLHTCRAAAISTTIVAAFLVSLVTGCSTPYQRDGFRGGYQDMLMAEDMFQVSFRGNGYTGSDRVQRYALRRAAELSLEKGFGYFVIVSDRPDSSSFVMHQSQTNAAASHIAWRSAYARQLNTTGYNIPSQA